MCAYLTFASRKENEYENRDKIAMVKLRIPVDKETYIPVGDLYKEQFYKYVNNKFVSK